MLVIHGLIPSRRMNENPHTEVNLVCSLSPSLPRNGRNELPSDCLKIDMLRHTNRLEDRKKRRRREETPPDLKLERRSVCEEKLIEKWKRRENLVGGLGRETGKMGNFY